MLCVLVLVVCVPGGSRGLLKLSQAGRSWQAGKYWERCRRRSGVGGCSLLRITAVSGALYFGENNGTSAAWTMPLSWPENNAPIFDNSYRKCYNKCNDDNKNVICHQTGYNALQSVFPL